MGIASTIANCGISSSGADQIAATSGEVQTLAIARRTLWLSNLILGLISMVVLWALRELVARWVFDDTTHASEVGCLGLGVLLTLIARSQTALLQGLHRIGDLVRVNLFSALCSALVGIVLNCWLGEGGVLGFVLAAPLVSIGAPTLGYPIRMLATVTAKLYSLKRLNNVIDIGGRLCRRSGKWTCTPKQ